MSVHSGLERLRFEREAGIEFPVTRKHGDQPIGK